ncbi:MAG: hypothetical protein PVG14_00430 [Anaerolineales bacterium]|jgi:hypothetical protein
MSQDDDTLRQKLRQQLQNIHETDAGTDWLQELAVLFQDFDWADEVLHAQIGRRWLLGALGLE